jgi:hypothetical protein
MGQLVDRVRHIERLKTKKARTHKHFRKEKVAYITSDKSNQEFDIAFGDVKIEEVDIADLKQGPPYTCKLLGPSDGNNPVKTCNERYVPKTYTFDVTKCDEIYGLLVADSQVVVPKDVKIPPLEQCQIRGFCKHHSFLGHNTARYSLFRDLVQNGLSEGRLKFGYKPKHQMQVNSHSLKDVNMIYTDIAGCNVVEAKTNVANCQVAVLVRNPKNNEELVIEFQNDERLISDSHLNKLHGTRWLHI